MLNAFFLPLGNIVVNELEQVAYSEKKIEKSPWLPDDRPTAPKVGSTIRECCAVLISVGDPWHFGADPES